MIPRPSSREVSLCGSIKEAIKLHFGFEIEDTHQESETKDEEQELIEEIPVPAGTKLLVTLEKEALITETPFSVDGYLDMGFTLDFEDWATSKHKQGYILFGTHKHSNKFKFNNLAHFEEWLHGYDVEFPGMKKYKPSDQAQHAMDEIFSLENRLVQSKGVRRKVFGEQRNKFSFRGEIMKNLLAALFLIVFIGCGEMSGQLYKVVETDRV